MSFPLRNLTLLTIITRSFQCMLKDRCLLIIGREFEATRVQLLMVDHHPGIFHMKDLHDVLPSINENKYTTITYILVHKRGDYPAQDIEALAYIHRQGVQVVLKGSVQMKHAFNLKDKQECGGVQDPDPGRSLAVFRWDILPPITSCLQCSCPLEPIAGACRSCGVKPGVLILPPAE